MKKIEMQDVKDMIDDYASHKADLKGAEMYLQAKKEMIEILEQVIEDYDIALYEGIIRKLIQVVSATKKEAKDAAEIHSALVARDNGFERRKEDVLSDFVEDNQLQINK